MPFIQGLRSIYATIQRYYRRLHWEFWPVHIFYLPAYLYYLYLSLRARSIYFFNAVNPSIKFSGLYGESKWEIYAMLPKAYLPRTFFISVAKASSDHINQIMSRESLNYPIILKPNVGERGRRVYKIDNHKALQAYVYSNQEDLILQEYVHYPTEIGVFYYRIPGEAKGTVSSIITRHPLTVTGDGISTVEQLMQQHFRTNLYIPRIRKTNPDLLQQVPTSSQQVAITHIYNPSRGAVIRNASRYITPEFTQFFDQLSKCIKGFYYGRYDIRCLSLEDIIQNKDFKILELNGLGSEVSHIYAPPTSLWRAYRAIFHHFSVFYKIAHTNNKLGHACYLSWREGLNFIKILRGSNKPL